jgi:PTS system cellobiose-specific IIB component
MINIALICNLGMSTSMLIKKMTDYAKEKGIETDIDAMPFDRMGDRINKIDILLIGPQVRHLLKKIQAEYGDKIPVIQVMDMSHYALLKADQIFDNAFAEYNRKTK